jgi:putative colanic acid biosynthesis UDP-glucose lipid carrier transferase
MSTKKINLYHIFFAGMDLFMLNVIHLALILQMDRISEARNYYIILLPMTNIVWLIAAYFNGLYENDRNFSFERFAKRSLKAFIFFCGFVLLYIFLYHYKYSRIFIMFNFVGFGIAIFLTRLIFMLFSFYLVKGSRYSRKVVILGYNELSKKLAHYFLDHNSNVSVEGYFEDSQAVDELSFYPILGNRQECLSYAIDNNISEIYSTLPPESNSYAYNLAQEAETNMIRFKFVPDFQFFVNRNVHIDYAADLPILSLRSEPLQEPTASIKKRLFDIVFSLFMIIFVLSWLLPILALLIKLDSKGPIFFVQRRSGKNNKPFRCIKLRTLRINREADQKQVTYNDSRLTRVGKFLRKANLDEFPQFFNVLAGTMSVVGPRPHMLKHTEDFSRLLNEYMIRHFIKPGVTGWAQVNGYRGEIRKEDQLRKRIEHDIWYMENWQVWLDFRIVLLTILVTIKGDKNAY